MNWTLRWMVGTLLLACGMLATGCGNEPEGSIPLDRTMSGVWVEAEGIESLTTQPPTRGYVEYVIRQDADGTEASPWAELLIDLGDNNGESLTLRASQDVSQVALGTRYLAPDAFSRFAVHGELGGQTWKGEAQVTALHLDLLHGSLYGTFTAELSLPGGGSDPLMVTLNLEGFAETGACFAPPGSSSMNDPICHSLKSAIAETPDDPSAPPAPTGAGEAGRCTAGQSDPACGPVPVPT